MGNSVSYHEPHCANYCLFHLKQTDNPFQIKIESVDKSVVLGEVEETKSQNGDTVLFDQNGDDTSVASARVADNRSSSAGMMLSKTSKFNASDRESCDWVNDLLAVFWEAWAGANVFHELVLNGIYNSVNLDRDASLAEIKCKAMQLEGKPPRIIWVKNA